MSQHPNVAGMKVGGYDLTTIIPISMMSAADFQVLGAGGSNHLVYLGLGVTCCTMSSASCFPHQHAKVHTLWEQGQLDAAREQAFWLNRLLGRLPPRRNTEAAAEEKAVLELLGICKRWVYPPFQPLDDDRMAQVRAVLEAHAVLGTTQTVASLAAG